ncbi:MAG: 30S ribosomal protein S12, partial [Candidatus Phytoplasma australasiaticum]|nr:30S ribosomal protein S12 [Candidatus Phytoplasma australasiaticum]
MPTISQLIRKRRVKKNTKTKSPALSVRFNVLKKKFKNINSPQKSGGCWGVCARTPKEPKSAGGRGARGVRGS